MSIVILQGSLFLHSFASLIFRVLRSIFTGGGDWSELREEFVQGVKDTERQTQQTIDQIYLNAQDGIEYTYIKTQAGIGYTYLKMQDGIGYLYTKVQGYNPFSFEIFGVQFGLRQVLEFWCFYFLFTRGYIKWYDVILITLWVLVV